METFQEYQRELLARRVRRHREGQREAGLCPRSRRRERRRYIALRRGDLVTLEPGRGQPRPVSPPARALLVQHDLFDAHGFVAVVPLSAKRVSAPLLRVNVGCDQQALVDQLCMIPRRAIRMVYGAIDAKAQREVDRALALYVGLVR